MAIQMYRKGDMAEIRGLMVDVQNFRDIHGALNLGWHMSPEEAYGDALDPEPLPEPERVMPDIHDKPIKRRKSKIN